MTEHEMQTEAEDPQLVNALIREELLMARLARVHSLLHHWDLRAANGEWFSVGSAAFALSRAVSEYEVPDD